VRIPKGMTESNVLDVINKVVNSLAPKFKFGFYDIEDIKQEAFIIAIEGLERYEEDKPLENFLFVHVRNRLITFKRDNYIRKNYVCKICSNKNPNCENCHKRQIKQNAKQFLMEPLDIYSINDENEPSVHDTDDIINTLTINEYTVLIDRHLPMSLRMDYIKMKSNVYVSKQRRIEIEEEINKILKEHADEQWQAY
jgi:DNA-directed RNA polymerase specialized sigma24 family protein